MTETPQRSPRPSNGAELLHICSHDTPFPIPHGCDSKDRERIKVQRFARTVSKPREIGASFAQLVAAMGQNGGNST